MIVEKQLENMISMENASILLERGLSCFDHDYLFRQIDMGHFGRLDLLGFKKIANRHYKITVYELKKKELTCKTIEQVFRYLGGLQDFVKHSNISSKLQLDYEAVVIGESINYDDFLLSRNINLLKVFTYTFDITGLNFEEITPDTECEINLNYGGLANKSLRKIYSLMRNQFQQFDYDGKQKI